MPLLHGMSDGADEQSGLRRRGFRAHDQVDGHELITETMAYEYYSMQKSLRTTSGRSQEGEGGMEE